MKFKLTTEHIYPWPVKVSVPNPDKAGEVIEQQLTITFRALSRAEGEALDAEIAALKPEEQQKRQDDVLRRVILGWDDQVVGDDGKPVPFSAEALEAAMQFTWFRLGCYRAYRDSLGGKAAQLGN